jgi:electron transport complex protein RnfG
MVAVMGSVGLIASIILVVTFQVTTPYIEANRRAYLEQAILDVIPGADSFVSFELTDGSLIRTEEPKGLYAGFDSTGVLAGVAVEARGQGYQEIIRILYGYAPACECIVGMKVLESKETPGLGDKIEKDERFLANFDALDVRTDQNGGDLLNPITLAKHGAKSNNWEIEAITGATVSSTAITTIIGGSAAEVVPIIRNQIEKLTRDQ